MARRPRLDAPGLVQHVMARGIEKRAIFIDDDDRYYFLRLLADLLPEEDTVCYAWVLMENHFHLLLRSSRSMATFMRRLLTRYALHFNKRHERVGHLFQNRYKSIVVDEDAYLCTLVCYIHANPLRARVLGSLSELSGYPFSGHGPLLGLRSQPWQNTEFVLKAFRSCECYLERMAECADEDLDGGGMSHLLKLEGLDTEAVTESQLFDERVLGSGEFVEQVRSLTCGQHLDERWATLVDEFTSRFLVSPRQLTSTGRERRVSDARAALIATAKREGFTAADIARRLGLVESTVARAVVRGESLARTPGDETSS